MRKEIIFVIIFLNALLASCKDTGTSSVGTGNGNIYSYVSLLDSVNSDDIIPRDFSSVRISIQDGPQSTYTDKDGQFELASVPTSGAFTLVFSKNGFAEERDIGHIFTPSQPGSLIEFYNTVRMYQIRHLTPDIVLRPFQSETGADTPYTRAIFSGRIIDSIGNNQQYSGYIKFYFGKSELLSAENPNTYLYETPFTEVDAESGIAAIGIYRDTLLHNGFSPLDKIYCVAYYTGFNTKSEFYIDKATGKRIYTGFSPYTSEIRNFILP